MRNNEPIFKNVLAEVRLINRRIFISAVIILLLLIVLLTRFIYLAGFQHHYYAALAQQNQYHRIPIAPTRGLIYDRNGVLLAKNIPIFSLDIIPDKVKNLTQTIEQLKLIVTLSKTDLANFYKQKKQHWSFNEIPLKMRLSKAERARFSVNQYKYPGVFIKARLMRQYPLGAYMANVVGYVGRINDREAKTINQQNYAANIYIGKTGIEQYYEAQLHGTTGYNKAEVNVNGKVIKIAKSTPPTPGKNIYLSIDSRLQKVAYDAFEDNNGAVVAMNPNNGKVLALVSHPGFNPNLFVNGIGEAQYQALLHDPNQPLFNRAIRGLYPLASTIKPYIALAALDSGLITTETRIDDPGWYKLPNSSHIFHDWALHGHGIIGISRAITVSCDTFFYMVAHTIGMKIIDNMLSQFGFGQLPHIDIKGALPGVLSSPAWKQKHIDTPWYPGDTIISGIGQGYMQASPLQLADAVTAMANRGQRYQPSLLLHSLVKPLNTVHLKDLSYWSTVIAAMHNVVASNEGTGFRFGRHSPYTVAAKTGTAQVVSLTTLSKYDASAPKKIQNHSLFIVFAPINHPRIAVAVVAENTRIAPEIARKVLDQFFRESHGTI